MFKLDYAFQSINFNINKRVFLLVNQLLVKVGFKIHYINNYLLNRVCFKEKNKFTKQSLD